MSQENVEIARRIDDAFIAGAPRGDFGAGFETGAVAEEHELLAPPEFAEQRSYRGREGFVEFLQRWTGEFEHYSFERKELIGGRDGRVFGAWRTAATGRRSGVPVEVEYFMVFELEQGQLVRTRIYLERGAALEAAGISE
jgi:ketosteroid isomerase-like protein